MDEKDFRVGTWVVQLVHKVINKSSPPTMAVTPHLACTLVYEVEHGFLFGVPVDALVQSLPPQLARDYLQQVHLYWLLNEHHVVLRHGCNQKRTSVGNRGWWHVRKTDTGDRGQLTKAVVVGGVGFVFRHDGTEHFGPL